MKKLADIAFDHDAPSEKIRKFGKGITYVQNGVVFSNSYEPIAMTKEREELEDLKESKKQKQKETIKKTAKKKRRAVAKGVGDKLKGFRKFDAPDKVSQALKENEQAEAAEAAAE